MSLRSLLFGLIMCSLTTAQLQAGELTEQPVSNATAYQFEKPEITSLFSDLTFAFEEARDVGGVDLVVLSKSEMQNTEGAWWPLIYHGGGALAGFYGAGYGYLAGGGRSPWGFVGTAFAGGAAGAWSPITGYRSGILTLGGSLSGGAVSGYGAYRGWW